MKAQQFLTIAECFQEPLWLLTQSGEILAANTPARVFPGLPADSGGSTFLTDYVEQGRKLVEYLRRCAVDSQAVAGFLTWRGNGCRMPCLGRALEPGTADTAIVLRGAAEFGNAEDSAALDFRFTSLHQEIARRHEVETELRAARVQAQAVLDTAVDGIITIDQHGVIQSFNQAAERMFGYCGSDVIGRNIRLLMPQPDRSRHDAYIRRYLSTGEKKIIGIGREVIGLRQDGSTFPLELAVSEVKFGETLHFTGILRDISERKRTEQRLRQQEEEVHQNRERLTHFNRISTLGEMATGIAHEINQPLTAISFYVRTTYELLSRSSTDSDNVLEILDKIQAQAERAGDIIQRLRHFARKRDGNRELCELNQLVRDTLVLLESDARQRHFRIETRLAEMPLAVVVDPVQIQQVVLNLVRNAVEAMIGTVEPNESIVVMLATDKIDPGMAQIDVIDKGTGIAEELADKLFDPFFSTKALGTGLGLSISRTIVTSHGGRLWFTNNEFGGTTMSFNLPLADNSMIS